MKDGRVKGNKYENRICRFLSQWVVPGDWSECPVYQLPFRRRFTDNTPLDGHWEGEGDILHRPGIEFPFCVECKDQEGWDLDGLLHNEKWPVWAWWEQACTQAQQVGLRPILFFTRAYRPDYVMMQKEVAECLELQSKHGPVVECRSKSGGTIKVTAARNVFAVPRSLLPCLSSLSADAGRSHKTVSSPFSRKNSTFLARLRMSAGRSYSA